MVAISPSPSITAEGVGRGGSPGVAAWRREIEIRLLECRPGHGLQLRVEDVLDAAQTAVGRRPRPAARCIRRARAASAFSSSRDEAVRALAGASCFGPTAFTTVFPSLSNTIRPTGHSAASVAGSPISADRITRMRASAALVAVIGRDANRQAAGRERRHQRTLQPLFRRRGGRCRGLCRIGQRIRGTRAHADAPPFHVDFDLAVLHRAVGLDGLERQQVIAGQLAADPLEGAGAAARGHFEERAARVAGHHFQAFTEQVVVARAATHHLGLVAVEHRLGGLHDVQRHARFGGAPRQRGEIRAVARHEQTLR